VWAAALRANQQQLAQRAQTERGRHRSVDAVFEMVERDGDVGGGIIAGAIAYRLFIWLLPLALVAVAGLGFAGDAASKSPEEAGKSLGIEGLISSSIMNAAESPKRWYALLIGIPALLWTTRSLLRVLISANRLVWSDVRAAAPKPTPLATLRLLVLLLSFGALTTLASALRSWAPGPGLIATLATVVAYAGLWLLISLQLPHRGTGWVELVPGALVYGVGVEVLNVVVAYVITPWALAKQGTYGALGIAAALLFGLYLVSRVVVGSAIVNATLWERQARPD
jgi:membrane protein